MRKTFVLLLTISLLFTCSFMPTLSAQAMSVEAHYPSFSLYCKDDVIKSEKIDYKVSSVTADKIVGNVEYSIDGTQGQEYDFYIPTYCPYYDIPQYDVKVNGATVATQFLYGENVALHDFDVSMENAIERSSIGVLDETATGTLYTFTANSDSLTVSFMLEDPQSIIFETGEKGIRSSSGVNGYSYTITTTVGKEYRMFVTQGDLTEFETTAAYSKERKTCKDYVDENYLPYEEMYLQGQMTIELFYAKMNRLLAKREMVHFDDFFWQQQTYSLNFYRFTVVLEQPTASITYSEKTTVQTKSYYEPAIHLFERQKSSSYPTIYTVELTEELPYIIENNVGLEKSELTYTATSTGDSFYCVYSSEKQPINNYDTPQNPQNTWIIVVVSVCSVLLVGCVVVVIVMKKKGY